MTKVKNVKNWKMIKFEDRVILPEDLQLLSASQRKAINNLYVINENGVLYVEDCESLYEVWE